MRNRINVYTHKELVKYICVILNSLLTVWEYGKVDC